MYNHITTIEIEENETVVSIDFNSYFGDIEVSKITNLETGDAIDVELNDNIYNELHEMAADFQADKTRFGR